MDTTYTASYTSDTLDEDLRKLDFTYNKADDLRDLLVEKLTPVVMDMQFDTKVVDREGAAALDSQMNVVKTYMDLLNDKEKSIKTKIDVKSKQKELVSNGQLIETFVSSIKEANKNRIANKQKNSSIMEDAEELLETRVAIDNIVIAEGELREDPTDLT
mgnify:CR=1 FL=1